jgi:hypothetical protein
VQHVPGGISTPEDQHVIAPFNIGHGEGTVTTIIASPKISNGKVTGYNLTGSAPPPVSRTRRRIVKEGGAGLPGWPHRLSPAASRTGPAPSIAAPLFSFFGEADMSTLRTGARAACGVWCASHRTLAYPHSGQNVTARPSSSSGRAWELAARSMWAPDSRARPTLPLP